MAEAPQFSPEELDRLEDALESLEGIELGLIEDESPAIQERLVDYRAILIASRDALPLEDVPEGALDRVLSLAADPGQDELAAAPGSDAQPASSWWTRFRRTLLVPALAVAGSAALILVIVRPSAEDAPVMAEASPQAAPAPEAKPTAATDRATPKSEAATAPQGAAAAVPADEADAEPPSEPEPEEEAEPDVVYEEIATTRSSVAKQQPGTANNKSALGASKLPAPIVAEGGESNDDDAKSAEEQKPTPRWDLIARGDRARTDGDCASARRHYEAALSDTDDRVQARANAGLGLCEAQRGRSSAADELYERARDLDPQIGDFLDQQANDQTESKAKPKPAKRSRKKSKRAPAPSQDNLDPFD